MKQPLRVCCFGERGDSMLGWLFGDSAERETERKANDIAASPFWDGGSAKDILRNYSGDQIDKIHEQIEEDEDFIDCMLF